MSIITGGFGVGAITTSGWGSEKDFSLFIPELLADYFLDIAYSSIIDREYISLLEREIVTIINRTDGISAMDRSYGDMLARNKSTINDRSFGWS
jgi:hypothetical protein